MPPKTNKPRRREEDAEVQIPKTDEEAAELIRQLGTEQQAMFTIQAKADEELEPHSMRLGEIIIALAAFCYEHRGELTQEGTVKKVKFATGQVWWNTPPLEVKVTGDKGKLVKLLEERGLTRLLKVVHSVDVDAVRKDPSAVVDIDQIHVEQVEQLKVKPAATDVVHVHETRGSSETEDSEAA